MSDTTAEVSTCAYCDARADESDVHLNYVEDEDELVCDTCHYVADPTPLHGLSAFQRDLLTAVAAIEAGGTTDISSKLNDHYPQLVNQGRVYPNVQDLLDRGLLEQHEREFDTPEYSLTETGRTALHNYRQWIATSLKTEGSN